MQTLPNSAVLPLALDHLVHALTLLDDTAETVIAARLSDVVDLLNARIPPPATP